MYVSYNGNKQSYNNKSFSVTKFENYFASNMFETDLRQGQSYFFTFFKKLPSHRNESFIYYFSSKTHLLYKDKE